MTPIIHQNKVRAAEQAKAQDLFGLFKQANEYLDYDAETGKFTWIKSPSSGVKAGTEAGRNSRSYFEIRLCNTRIQAHRLAFLVYHGRLPAIVDHINGDPFDNRICNLREVDTSQSVVNRKTYGKSGFKGVTKVAGAKTWTANISFRGVTKYLGCFQTAEEAHEAYKKVAAELHGEYARKQ